MDPADPTEPFTHDMTDERLALYSETIRRTSYLRRFARAVRPDSDGVRVVNVGSVGEACTGSGPRHAEATFLEFPSRGLADNSNRRGADAAGPGVAILVEQVIVPLADAAIPCVAR
jgi:hypothetical protein